MTKLSTRQKKKNNSDEKILRSAVSIFGSNGYTNASLTAVAAGAGVSQSLVSQRFGSKENLLLESFKSVVEPYVEACGEDTGVPDVFYLALDYLKELAVEDPESFAFLVQCSRATDYPHRVRQYADKDFVTSVFFTAIKEAQEEGKFPKGDPVELYMVFFRCSTALLEWHQKASIPFPDNDFFLMSMGYEFGRKDDGITEQLREELIKAQTANATKTDYMFTMSHDIRTPLNSIIGFVEVAKNHMDDMKKVEDCLNNIGNTGRHLLTIISDISDMTSAENGRVEILEEEADFFEFTTEFRQIAESIAIQKNITLEFTGEIYNRHIYADMAHIKRCLAAVVNNAIKFSPEGSKVEISINQLKTDRKGYGVYSFIVRDHGPGITPEFMERLFEPFATEGKSDRDGIYGAGLGLPTAKGIIEAMNGTIEAESEVGKGSTFTITLPLKVREYIGIVPATADTAESGRRLLLVEDNELNRELTLELLVDRGFYVDEAEDGVYAVEMLEEKGPEYYSVILMDIQMPRMNGYEATKKIREMYPGYHIPIIAVSANAMPRDRRMSAEAGMDAHIAKPIRIESLYEAIIKAISSKTKTDALTHVKNRMAYEESCDVINSYIQRGEKDEFAVIVCDVNDLKTVNDTKGHEAGDELIKSAAKTICDTFSLSPVYRIGGDEFAVILKGIDYENREELLSEFRQRAGDNKALGEVVVASGMAVYSEDDTSISDVFFRADREMYANKYELKK